MQTRNAFIILMRILPHFPILSKLAQIIEKRVEQVIADERNQRQDLFVLASSYIGQLKSKANDMVREADFHIVSDKPVKEPVENPGKVTNGNGTNAPIVIVGKSTVYSYGCVCLCFHFCNPSNRKRWPAILTNAFSTIHPSHRRSS